MEFILLAASAVSLTGLTFWQSRRKRAKPPESFRLEVLENTLQNPQADICFVHGINDDGVSAWLSPPSDGRDEFSWPTYLQETINARILLYNYSTIAPTAEYLARRTLYCQAEHLVRYLADARKDHPQRPLIFVAHSLGGVVVKSALILSSQNLDETDLARGVMLSTAGIVFLGTPHRVYTSINSGRTGALQRIASATGFNKKVVKHLDEESRELQNYLEPFEALSAIIPIMSFYETLPIKGFDVLVPESAMDPRSKRRPLESNHFDLAKFYGPNDKRYKKVSSAVRQLCRDSSVLVEKNWRKYKRRMHSTAKDKTLEHFNLPSQLPQQAPHFTGRNDALKWIERNLLRRWPSNGQINCRTVNLYGSGGIGKTEIALAFARGFRDRFSSVFWIPSHTQMATEKEFVEIAKTLRLRTFDATQEVSAHETAYSVLEWLKSSDNTNWLLIFDHVDPSVTPGIMELVPSTTFDHGHVIITSRIQLNEILGQAYQVKPLKRAESKALLKGYLGLQYPDDSDLDEVSQALDGHPLQLSMAGNYMKQKGLSPSQYLKVYRKQPPELTAVEKSIAEMNTDKEMLLFSMCCVLGLNSVPLWVFTEGSAPFLAKKTLQQCISKLEKLGLIVYQPVQSRILILREVRDRGRGMLSEGQLSYACRHLSQTASYVAAARGDVTAGSLEPSSDDAAGFETELLELVLCSLSLIQSQEAASQEWDIDCEELGKVCEAGNKFDKAREFYELHVKRGQSTWASIARAKIRMAMTWYKADKVSKTSSSMEERRPRLAPLFQRAVKEAPDEESLLELRSLNREQDDPMGELDVLRMIIEAQETRWGPIRTPTLESVQEVASHLLEQGFLEEAEGRLRRILLSYRTLPIANRSHASHFAESLVSVCVSLGKLDEAEAICYDAIRDYQRRLGSGHALTKKCLAQLAWIYCLKGRCGDAEELFEDAIATLTRTDGPDQLNVLQIEQNRAQNLVKWGKLREGQKLLESILRRMEAHPAIYPLAATRKAAAQLVKAINEDLSVQKEDELWITARNLENIYNLM